MKFSHTESTVHDVPVLQLRGDVDVLSAPELRELLEDLLATEPVSLVIDLSEVNFFDSTGLRVLNDVDRRARGQQTVLSLAGLHERVLRLFQITGLDQRFAIHDSVEDAAGAPDVSD